MIDTETRLAIIERRLEYLKAWVLSLDPVANRYVHDNWREMATAERDRASDGHPQGE